MQKKNETAKEIRINVDAETIMRLRKMAKDGKITLEKAAEKILSKRC